MNDKQTVKYGKVTTESPGRDIQGPLPTITGSKFLAHSHLSYAFRKRKWCVCVVLCVCVKRKSISIDDCFMSIHSWLLDLVIPVIKKCLLKCASQNISEYIRPKLELPAQLMGSLLF